MKDGRKIVDATNWDAIHAEYVAGSESISSLAIKHRVSKDALEKRATRGDWVQERRNLSEKVQQKALSSAIQTKANCLAKLNESDLAVANALRDRATHLLKMVKGASNLRSLASVFEIAQRIGRIALNVDRPELEEDARNQLPVAVIIERRDCRATGLSDGQDDGTKAFQ